MRAQQTLAVLDGSNLAYRSFYAMEHLKTSTGVYTGAVYGMVHMLRNIYATLRPSHWVVAWDCKSASSFRRGLYPEYKATRVQKSSNMGGQWKLLDELCAVLGVPTFRADTFEADDVIATAASCEWARQRRVVVCTGDKDMAQLVDRAGTVLLYDSSKGLTDWEGVEERLGVPPDKVVDFLAIRGDTSDNIPGLKGIGPKRAQALLAEHGSVEGLLAFAPTSLKNPYPKIAAAADELRLWKALTQLRVDVPLPDDLETAWRVKRPGIEERRAFYTKLEFDVELRELAIEERKCKSVR